MAMQDIVKIHENDNVAVALRPLAKGRLWMWQEQRSAF